MGHGKYPSIAWQNLKSTEKAVKQREKAERKEASQNLISNLVSLTIISWFWCSEDFPPLFQIIQITQKVAHNRQIEIKRDLLWTEN